MMKQCPKCRSTYTDDTLGFCLADGTGLVAVPDEQATFVRPGGEPLRVDLPQTAPTVSVQPAVSPNRSSNGILKVLLAVAILCLLLVIGVGGLGALWYFKSATPASNEKAAAPVNSPTNSSKTGSPVKMPANIDDDVFAANDPVSTDPKTNNPDPLANDPVVKTAKNSPDDFDAQIAAAELYYQKALYDNAIRYYRRANSLDPNDLKTVVRIGDANFDAKHWEEAEKWYLAALAEDDTDVAVRNDLGLTFVLRDQPDYDRAIQEFESALELEPSHSKSLQNLTVAYTRKGDAESASATLERLVRADPKNKAIAQLKQDIQKIGKK